MKKKLSGYKKFFGSNTFFVTLIAVLVLSFGIFIFTYVNANGGFAFYYNRLFPSAQTKSTSTKPGVVDTFNTSTDKANGKNTTTQPAVQTGQSNNVPLVFEGCKETNIVPHGTTYEKVGYLYTDESQTLDIGSDGYTYTCTLSGKKNSSTSTVIKPTNSIVYVGTKERPATTTTTGTSDAEYQRRINLANCLAAVANSGVTSSATEVCHRNFGY
jgi:hypothetical protein